MTSIGELIESGRIIDFILLMVVAEALLLIVVHKWSGMGPKPSRLIPNLAAGGSLLFAVKAALADAGAMTIAAILLVSLIAHVWDLAMRWN